MRDGLRPHQGVALALGLVLMLGGCGGSSAKPGPPPELHTIDVAGEVANYHGTADLQTPKLSGTDVAMEDYFFSPTVVIGGPETEIELTLSNDGTTTHNFSIEELQIDTDVPAGEARTLSVSVPRIGGYVVFCKYFATSGMRGAINNPSEPAPTLVSVP